MGLDRLLHKLAMELKYSSDTDEDISYGRLDSEYLFKMLEDLAEGSEAFSKHARSFVNRSDNPSIYGRKGMNPRTVKRLISEVGELIDNMRVNQKKLSSLLSKTNQLYTGTKYPR